MIRSELIARIAQQNPHLTVQECEGVVRATLGTISDALARGDRVELRDFGTFSVRDQDAHTGRNPRTGAVVAVPAKLQVYFRAGKGMQTRLNRRQFEPEEVARRLLKAS